MKKLMKLLLIVAIVAGIGYVIKIKIIDPKAEKERIAEIKKGWYVEVVKDELKIREKGQIGSSVVKVAKKGEVYKCLGAEKDSSYVWYKIEYEKGKVAFIANTKSYSNLKSYNSEEDFYSPIIKYYDNVYLVESINDINYDHLYLWDDKEDYTVTHEVYHEVKPDENIDQYWIRYTISDKAGNSSSKTQKIEFNKKPKETEVKSWAEYPLATY